eukprot:m.237433 g.237433  ORF g.237433 m.237433 type:complete len:330 (+) comp13135_c0_seq1:118-1107(+)
MIKVITAVSNAHAYSQPSHFLRPGSRILPAVPLLEAQLVAQRRAAVGLEKLADARIATVGAAGTMASVMHDGVRQLEAVVLVPDALQVAHELLPVGCRPCEMGEHLWELVNHGGAACSALATSVVVPLGEPAFQLRLGKDPGKLSVAIVTFSIVHLVDAALHEVDLESRGVLPSPRALHPPIEEAGKLLDLALHLGHAAVKPVIDQLLFEEGLLRNERGANGDKSAPAIRADLIAAIRLPLGTTGEGILHDCNTSRARSKRAVDVGAVAEDPLVGQVVVDVYGPVVARTDDHGPLVERLCTLARPGLAAGQAVVAPAHGPHRRQGGCQG